MVEGIAALPHGADPLDAGSASRDAIAARRVPASVPLYASLELFNVNSTLLLSLTVTTKQQVEILSNNNHKNKRGGAYFLTISVCQAPHDVGRGPCLRMCAAREPTKQRGPLSKMGSRSIYGVWAILWVTCDLSAQPQADRMLCKDVSATLT